MLISEPLPDELALGHLHRIRRLNDMTLRRHETIVDLVGRTGADIPLQRQVLANFSGMSDDEYLRRHSMLALSKRWRLMGQTCKEGDHALDLLPQRANKAPVETLDLRYRLCPQCREEDLQTFSLTYWHRLHQIPGIDTCPAHGCVMQLHTREELIDNPCPVALDGPVSAPELVHASTHPILMRYKHLASVALKHAAHLDYDFARDHVRAIGRRSGLVTDNVQCDDPAGGLASLLERSLPLAWLQEHCSHARYQELSVNTTTPGLRYEVKTVVRYFHFHAAYLLLALAALCDSVDKAEQVILAS
jgi:hypothetical protein